MAVVTDDSFHELERTPAWRALGGRAAKSETRDALARIYLGRDAMEAYRYHDYLGRTNMGGGLPIDLFVEVLRLLGEAAGLDDPIAGWHLLAGQRDRGVDGD